MSFYVCTGEVVLSMDKLLLQRARQWSSGAACVWCCYALHRTNSIVEKNFTYETTCGCMPGVTVRPVWAVRKGSNIDLGLAKVAKNARKHPKSAE